MRSPSRLSPDTASICVLQDGRIRYANPAFAELLRIPRERLEGNSFLALVFANDRAAVEAHLQRRLMAEGEPCGIEARCVRPDGHVVQVEMLETRIEYDGLPALVETIIDITARSQVEAEMDDRLRFEQLLANLSASFVNVPVEQIQRQIDESLQLLVALLGNDRSKVVEFGDDPTQVLVTHSYAVPGFQPFPLGPLPIDRLPWFIGQFRDGNRVFVRNTPDDLARHRPPRF